MLHRWRRLLSALCVGGLLFLTGCQSNLPAVAHLSDGLETLVYKDQTYTLTFSPFYVRGERIGRTETDSYDVYRIEGDTHNRYLCLVYTDFAPGNDVYVYDRLSEEVPTEGIPTGAYIVAGTADPIRVTEEETVAVLAAMTELPQEHTQKVPRFQQEDRRRSLYLCYDDSVLAGSYNGAIFFWQRTWYYIPPEQISQDISEYDAIPLDEQTGTVLSALTNMH